MDPAETEEQKKKKKLSHDLITVVVLFSQDQVKVTTWLVCRHGV
jgi:hypothetical protein